MLSRKVSIKVVIGIIVVTFATAVGLVYAAEQIIGTEEVSATVNIVTAAQFLRTCRFDDSSCNTPFTGDLPFGDMSRGATKTVKFRIKNTQSSGGSGLLVDARIRFNNVVTKLEIKDTQTLTGDVPNLGRFEVKYFDSSGSFGRSNTDDVNAGEVRRVEVKYTAASNVAAGALNFDVLLDVVDAVE